MYKLTSSFLTCFCSIFLLAGQFGCKRAEEHSLPIAQSNKVLTPPLSELVFPLAFSVKELEAVLNEKIEGKFVKAWFRADRKRDSLYLEVTKSGPIRLQWDVPTLSIVVPLHLEGKFLKNIGSVHVENKKPIVADILLHLKSDVHFDKHWQLVFHTALEKLVWRHEPKLKVLFVQVGLKKKIDKIVEERGDYLTRRLDREVSKKLNLRRSIAKLWLDIQKPIRINKKGEELWLQNRCETINWNWVDRGDSLLAVQLKAYSMPRISVDAKPSGAINRKLPECVRSKKVDDNHLNLYVYSKIDYDLINDRLKRMKYPFELEHMGQTLKVQNISVYGLEANELALKVKVSGSVEGIVYLKGKPVYEPQTNKLKVTDFEYDLGVDNALVNGADWILHSSLIDRLKDRLVVDVDSLVKQVPNLIVRGIEKSKVGKKIDLQLPSFSVYGHSLVTTKENIQLILQVKAVATLLLEKKVFLKKRKKLQIVRPK